MASATASKSYKDIQASDVTGSNDVSMQHAAMQKKSDKAVWIFLGLTVFFGAIVLTAASHAGLGEFAMLVGMLALLGFVVSSAVVTMLLITRVY